jgi:predicted porin
MPAYSADLDVDALKAELVEQRKLIDQLLANQKAQPVAAPATAPAAAPVASEVGAATTGIQFKVYGVADVSLVNANSGFGRKTRIEGGGGMSASRLGFSASRTFDNGIQALAVLEGGLQIGSGGMGGAAPVLGLNDTFGSSGGAPGTGPQIFARQAFGGLAGRFGQVTIGRQYTGSYIAAAVVGSAWPDGLYGTTASFAPLIGGMPTRVNNSIVWMTPKVGGFKAVATYTSGANNNVDVATVNSTTTTTTDKAGQGWDLAGLYSMGPLNVALTTWNVNNNVYATVGETALAKKKGVQLSANYDFGPVKLATNIVHGTISGGNYENVTKTLSNATSYSLSMIVPIGTQHRVMATATSFNDKSLLNRDAKLFGLAYMYTMATNTNLYVSVGKMANNANASYTLPDAANLVGTTSAAGVRPTGVEVGLNYAF